MSTIQEQPSTSQLLNEDDDLLLIDEDIQILDSEDAELIDLTDEAEQNNVQRKQPEEVDLTEEDQNDDEEQSGAGLNRNRNGTEQNINNEAAQNNQRSPEEVDLTEEDETSQNRDKDAEQQNGSRDNGDLEQELTANSSHQNGTTEQLDDANQSSNNNDQSFSSGICYHCKERKIFRNGLCYRCRGVGGPAVTKHVRRPTDYHRQADEEFLARCQEAAGRRRVSNKPLTFSEEFLNPKRMCQEPTTRQSLPNRLNTIITLNGIKQEPMDEEQYGSNLPHLNDQQVKPEMEDIKPQIPLTRMRVCITCKELKKHHAKGRCLNCYRDVRKSEAALAEETKKKRALSNSKIRLCIGCRKQTYVECQKLRSLLTFQTDSVYAKNKRTPVGLCSWSCANFFRAADFETIEEKPSIAQQRGSTDTRQSPEDFSNYRVCQECKEFTIHHCRGMCRPCYEQSLKTRRYDEEPELSRSTRHARHERQQSEVSSIDQINLSSLTSLSSAKKTMVGVTRCVVCNAVMQEVDLRSQRTIVCRKCHQEGKTRHRWCVGCGQLRVHDGANRCRPCHLAYKKGVSRGPVDLNNPRYRGKFDAQSPPGASVHVETRSRDSFSAVPQAKKTRPSTTHCVVCETALVGNAVWSPTSATCRKCHATGKERMRWCVGCGQLKLKFDQGRGRCRECYKIMLNGDEPKEEDLEAMDGSLVGDENEDEDSQPNDLLAQLGAILNQFSAPDAEESSQNTSQADTNITTRHSRPTPTTTASSGRIVVPELSQEDVQQKIDELTNPVAVNCLVCRTPIDFSIQMRNAKICLTCRDKGLQRMRWCVDCNKLKFHQGRGRCQECYRAIRSSGVSNAGQQRADESFDDQPDVYPIVSTSSAVSRNRAESVAPIATSKEERQRQFRSKLQELCLQFPDLEEAQRLPTLVQKAFNLHITSASAQIQSSRQAPIHSTRQASAQPTFHAPIQSRRQVIAPNSRQNQDIHLNHINRLVQAQRQVSRQSQNTTHNIIPEQTQQTSRSRFVPPPLRPGEPKLGAQCLICPNRIDFSKQLKTAKVCVECTAKNLKRHRWCVDCKKLKPCIGRGRCSFCYTIHMKEQKSQQKSNNSHNIDSTSDFNESNDPEALLQQILQASGIRLESMNGQNGAEHNGLGDDDAFDEDPDEVERTVGEILGHRPRRSTHAVQEEFGRRGQKELSRVEQSKRLPERNSDEHRSLAQVFQNHSDVNYVTLSSEDES